MVFGKGIPVVSVLIWNQGQSKLYRIGDMMEEITIQADVDHLTQVYTGKLVGIELGPAQVRADKPGYMSYDNIPTDGYENPICAMVPNIDATHEVVKILIQTEDGSYIPLMMEEIDSIRLADNEWITSVKEALESYLDSADLSGINEISLDNDQNTIDISIFDKDILNLGFVDFLATVEGLVSATARINNQTYVMTIGSEETYDTFRQGLLDSIPTQSGETVKGDLTMANGDGTSLVYTLKVTYFNQADEFNKITDYLDGYSAEDATVVKSADKTYTVTTHVASGDLLFDLIGAVVGIENLTNVKLTIGQETTESTDAATLREFLNARIPFSSDAAQAVVTVEVTAGELTETYSVTYASDYIADPEAIIGTKRYATLAEAVAAAVSGETIELQKDLTVNNTSSYASSDPNYPVIGLNPGVSFNGGNHTITADAGTWVANPSASYGSNHIIGISEGNSTISNVTLIGHAGMKSGVVVNGAAVVTLDGVTVQNCGNCGVQVAGATVTVNNLNTSGNAWGAMNVDKNSSGSMPNVTFNSGTMAEQVEIYTEITDQNVVTAPSLTKFQGFGTSLKGFVYYTSDPSLFEVEAHINSDKWCETLNDALTNAVSGDTITLQKNLTLNNVSATAVNQPVVVIPNGVTFDGADHTITADVDTWIGSNANHIVGASNTTATIKNLNVVGHANTKSGIVCFGQTGNVTLENVDVKNCGNCGVQVAGATVSATGLTTSGNAWGGVNADMGSDGSTPALTIGDGCTFAENAEVYTEITDQDVITAADMTKYQGYGETLKGFIYYTTDVSRLGTITAGNVVYETLNDAADSETPVEVTLTQNLTENLTVPVGGNLTIDGAGKTISGAVVCTAAGSGNSSLTLKNLTVDGSNGEVAYGIRSQNQTDNDQMELTLNLENVNVQGFSRKAIYGTNIKTLNITGGKIADCATGQMDDPNTQGDYAIDLNLVAVQGVTVVIDGVTFSGDLGDKAAIKITQRGGASDQGASDIPKNVGEASIESVVIQNCDFSGSTTEVDFRIGTDNKTPDGDGLNTTGAFAVTLTGNTEMVVQSAYLEDEPTLTVPAGRSASKTDSTDIALDMTTEETLDSIMAAIPGASEESDNVYTITTSDTIDMSFVDQIIALDGFASMTVSDGDASYSYTTGTDASYFKSQIQTLLPTSNESETVNLTITVNFSA